MAQHLATAHRLARRLEIHYTPRNGSWLNVAEIELSATGDTVRIEFLQGAREVHDLPVAGLVEAGPVGYDAGEAYFRRSFAVRGLMGTLFSSGGDSGSAIVAGTTEEFAGRIKAEYEVYKQVVTKQNLKLE